MTATIFKIVPMPLWCASKTTGRFAGSPVDIEDGFIHFSTAAQVRETAARHFAGQADLLLVEVATALLGADLRWEASRGGDMFPHLYADLLHTAVTRVWPLPVDTTGRHIFPTLDDET